MSSVPRSAACALATALTVGFLTLPAAAQAADPPSVSEAAQALAAIRADRKAAETAAAEAQVALTEAAGRVESADDAVADALAVDRATRRVAQQSAAEAQDATAAETRARARAQEAQQVLSRIARDAYINAMSNSDLELFAGFAADGPQALVNMARRDMTLDNLGDASIVDAQRTVATAAEAGATADEAQAARDDADAQYQAAHDTFTAAKRTAAQATRELLAAQSAGKQARADMATADARYDKAQEVYKVALRESLADGGGAPISSGPAVTQVWDTLKDAGFSEESIAGILGNLQQESGVDPTVIQSNGVGHGLAQWSAGGRWDNGPDSLMSFASARGLDPWAAATQVQFMIYEMENGWGGFDIEMFKDMTDVLEACVYFHDVYEASADSADFVRQVRGSYALQWYARLS